MSNRLEWREISTQGINPNEGLRTYMDGLNNAHAATNSIRQNQRIDNQATIENHSRLLNDALKVDAHQESKKQQAIANDQRQQYLDNQSKGKAPAYDRLALNNFATQHFEKGGTLETLANDETFGSTFNTTDPKVMDDLLAIQRGYVDRLGNERIADEKLLQEQYAQNMASAPKDLSPEGLEAFKKQHDDKLAEGLAGLGVMYNAGISTRSRERNQQLLGTAVSNRNENGSAERPSLSRVKASDTLRKSVISDTDQRKAELEKELEAGMDLEDYNTQMGQLESYRENSLKQIDDEDNRSNIKSFTGATVGVDYSISSSGSLVVGGKDVPERVGSALIQAAELSGQPLDIILPFASTESSYDPNAVSEKGVKGLMQVTGDTANEVYNRHKALFDSAGLAYDPNDRFNPKTSALLGALYIGEIRDKLGNDAPMEMVYMAYNLGPNDKLLNPSHNKNTPIDQLVPVSAGKISIGLDNNRGIYQNKDKSWKTLNQAAEEIRRRAGVSDITLSNPAATIEEQVTAYNRANNVKVPTEPSEDTGDTSGNYTAKDFREKTDSTLRAAFDTVNRYIPTPVVEGKDAKPIIDLTKGEIETMLAGAGIEGLNEKTAGKIYQKITKDDTLKRLNSDQIGMLLSWTPKGNFTKDIDDIGLDRNIEFIKKVWTRNETALKLNMDDAILAKKIMSDFQAKANPLKEAIRRSKEVIAETGLKLDDDTLSDTQKAAYRLDMDTHTNKLIESQRSLNFHSDHTAKSVNPLLNNIARFTKTLEDTYADEEDRQARIKVEELARNRTATDAEINRELDRVTEVYSKSPLPYTGMNGFDDYLGGRTPKKNSEDSNQFTGNPFKDYATNKRLAESKNK